MFDKSRFLRCQICQFAKYVLHLQLICNPAICSADLNGAVQHIRVGPVQPRQLDLSRYRIFQSQEVNEIQNAKRTNWQISSICERDTMLLEKVQ